MFNGDIIKIKDYISSIMLFYVIYFMLYIIKTVRQRLRNK